MPIPRAWLAAKTDSVRSVIVLSYTNDVPAEAQSALEYATQIWASILTSRVPINIAVTWDTLAPNVLASSGPSSVYHSFLGPATPTQHWYPVALAESLRGLPLNGADPDITLTINSAIDWYYGDDQQPGSNQYDFVMVACHELAHGLGFFSPASTSGDTAELGLDGRLLIYEAFLQGMDSISLSDVAAYPNPSEALFTVLTGDSLYFDCPDAVSIHGDPLRIHAPAAFRRGSSVAHLDEATYAAGSAHSLMTPNISRQEANHNPGDLTLCVMSQMGWETTPLPASPTEVRRAEPTAQLSLYPNPAGSWLQVRGVVGRQAYHILDMQGRVVQAGQLDRERLSVLPLAQGYYVFEIESLNGRMVHLPFVRQ
jgi:hypothetical protein